jgi:hypothetical protein
MVLMPGRVSQRAYTYNVLSTGALREAPVDN